MKKYIISMFIASSLVLFTACSHEESKATQTSQSVTVKGNLSHLEGTLISVGDKAPSITVVTKDLKEKIIGGKQAKTQILVIVPSIDTPICNLESRTFNEKVAELKDVDLTVVSMDLPFALGRFCAAKGIDKITMASDYRYQTLGKAYGVRIADGKLKGILARAIFVIKDGKVVYKQLVKEVSTEPDYEAVLKAI